MPGVDWLNARVNGWSAAPGVCFIAVTTASMRLGDRRIFNASLKRPRRFLSGAQYCQMVVLFSVAGATLIRGNVVVELGILPVAGRRCA
jgi:hypothetical protein